MEITYRNYAPTDRKAVQVLAKKILEWAGETNPMRLSSPREEFAEPYLDNIEAKLKDGSGFLLVAEAQGQIMGYIYGYKLDKTHTDIFELKPETTGQIEDFIVDERFRGNGIGTELLQKMEETLKANGCAAVILYTAPHCPAHVMYIKKGFQEFSTLLHKKL